MTKKECLQKLHKRTGGKASYSASEEHWYHKGDKGKVSINRSVTQFVNDVCFTGHGKTWEECLDSLSKNIKHSVAEARAKLEATAAIEVAHD